ncbi:MAG: hypothetical protein PWP57_851 [Candidatus Atribacteria bacterium]|nr:hypothetical protein [Candidatus Atribacteria bacterium]
MKKYIFLGLTIIIFNFTLTLYAQEMSSLQEIPKGYVFYQYQYAYLDISLIYPEDWINYSSQERGVLIDTPDSKGSIMILGTPLFGEEYTLEKLWAENMENLKLAGATFQESVPDTLSGYPAIKALYTIKIGEDIHQYICYSSIIGDLFYTFSFHAPVNDFEKYREEVLTIVRSVSIKNRE